MARFLFVVVPLVAHVWPAVAIAGELTAAGHDVAWCGSESDLRPLAGPDAVIYPTGRRSFRQPAQLGMAAVREVWDEYLIPFNRFLQDPVDSAVAEHQPDVVVADQYALAGALAAHRRGVRWATLAAGVLELTPPPEPGLQEWVGSRLALVWQKAGLPVEDGLDLRFSPHLVIATTTQGLTGLAALPPHWLLAGAVLGPRRTDPGFSWDWWDPARQHVLVTAGTVSAQLAAANLVRGFFARVTAALEPLAGRVQAVLNVAVDAVPAPPPHVLVARQVPMLELMPRLDAVICQAGQSTVNEALVHGVPLVVAPIRLAEPLTAEHVTRTGAGIAVSFSEATPAQLTAALTAVLDEPGYRARARALGEGFAAAGGAGAAAARLAALADGRWPRPAMTAAGRAGPAGLASGHRHEQPEGTDGR
ncbi:MAG TPA: nucleotide disphospho-sugar-binding domain-containing protein [Streptosporangiaceae bacterium]